MACATKLGAVSFCTAPALDPSYSCIELVEYHSEPQRMRRSPVTLSSIQMNTSPSEGFTPDTGTTYSGNDTTEQNVSTVELRQAFEEMFLRQRQLEAELASMRSAASRPEAERPQAAPVATPQEEVPLSTLMRTLLQTLTATAAANSAREPSGPREWKPPSWDGRADTFRDYLLRIRSSYRIRLVVKPTLLIEYY